MEPIKQKLIRKTFFLLLFFYGVTIHSMAQFEVSGKEFYVAFGKNDTVTTVKNVMSNQSVEGILRITTLIPSDVTLSFTENAALDTSFHVSAGEVCDIVLNTARMRASYSVSNGKTQKSIHVTATEPISLVALNTANHSIDATLIFPVPAWGMEYYNLGLTPYYYAPDGETNNSNGYILIAKEDNTNITGDVTVTLNAGEVYHRYISNGTTSGRHIESDKPIAFFNSGTSVTPQNGTGSRYCHNFEQYLPVNAWGTKFILPTSDSDGAYARIIPKDANTTITVTYTNGTTNTTTTSSIMTVIIDQSNNNGATACYITSDKPVGICSYYRARTSSWAWQPGELWLSPLEQRIRNVLISPLDVMNGYHVYLRMEHYFAIIVPTASKNSTSVSVEGGPRQPIQDISGFTWVADNIGGSGYSFGRYFFGESNAPSNIFLRTNLVVDNPDGLIALAWGQGSYTNYSYTVGSAYRDLTAGYTVNGENYVDIDGRPYCDTSDFTFVAYPDTLLNVTHVYWTLNDVEIPGSTDQLTVTVNNLPDGYYTVNMIAHGIDHITHFYVGGGPVIWTPELNASIDKRNWNNPFNWTPVLVPTTCHNVFIPGNLANYPELTSQVSCNNIYFMQGAELGRPDLLKYNKAYVQMNFDLKQAPGQTKDGNMDLVLQSTSTSDRLKYSAAVSSTPLNRERWYLLSSPLRGAVTGDLGFGGFPLTFLMKFGPVEKDNINYQVGKWTTTYTSMTDSVSTAVTDGFAFYMYGFGMTGDNTGCLETGLYATLNDMPILPSNRSTLSYGLKETNGILELPFFADSTGLYAHRTQVYEGDLTRRSTFFAIDDGTSGTGMATFNHLTGTSKQVTREANGGNYRFIPETYNGSAWVFPPTVNHPGTGIGSDDEFLVGNPYMSSIDMAKFITENSATILPQFRVWNGSAYIDYTVSGGVVTSPIPGDLNPGYIAPLQAFILRSDGNPGGGTVAKFNVSTISAVRPSGASNLRSTTAEENIIRIKAENNFAASYMLIGYKENASSGFLKRGDVQKLFSFLDYVPEIYALADNTPASFRFVGNKKEEIVPLGIKTGRTGEIRLTFTGMDNYSKATKIELIDAKENRTVDLTGKSSYTYTFNHTETGISNGRLSLRIGASMTAIQDIAVSDELKVYGDSEGIYVLSSSSDPVQQLIIYDFQGKKIYESASGANYYPMQGNTGHSPLIVKVITKNGMKTVKLVISD